MDTFFTWMYIPFGHPLETPRSNRIHPENMLEVHPWEGLRDNLSLHQPSPLPFKTRPAGFVGLSVLIPQAGTEPRGTGWLLVDGIRAGFLALTAAHASLAAVVMTLEHFTVYDWCGVPTLWFPSASGP